MVIDGRYELDALPLGQGGMGEVYGAYDQKLDRRVAVKLIHFPYGRSDEGLVKRFLHEARIMAKLEHPGTPPIHDVGVFEDPKLGPRPFMVMQFVEGATVDHILGEHGVLSVGWAASIAAQVATVLCAAHERGIFHRDLKPSNLMVCPDGTVKVLDFGLAMFHDPELSKLTRTGAILGTPLYMSPEQVRGAVVTPQSDLYSLGVILHEMLTGERLFDAETDYRILERQVHDAAPSVREHRSDVPAELDRLVLQMLAKRAEDRPARARLLHTALLSFVNEVDPLPRVASLGPSPVRMYAEVVSHLAGPRDTGSAADPPEPSRPTHFGNFSRADLARAWSEAEELAEASRYGQAVEVLDAVVAPASRVAGPLDEDVLALRLRLGEVLFEGGDYRRAAPIFGELRVDLARKHGPHDEGVLHCHRQEATCQALMGETGQALEMLRSLLVQEQAIYGGHDPRPLELRRQIGLLELGAGDTERARHTLFTLLEDLVQLYGPDHPDTVKVRDGLTRISL